MALLSESVQKQVRQVFEGIEGPVKLMYFTQGESVEGLQGLPAVDAGQGIPSTIECAMCADTRQLAEEVAGLSEKITLEVVDFVKDKETAEQYKVDKIPAIAILGPENKDYGIRLYGIPSGYEFGTLIEDILMISKGKSELSKRTLEQIGKLDRPVHIQVYTTPT